VAELERFDPEPFAAVVFFAFAFGFALAFAAVFFVARFGAVFFVFALDFPAAFFSAISTPPLDRWTGCCPDYRTVTRFAVPHPEPIGEMHGGAQARTASTGA
jgi:hypothetical protein